MIAHWKPIETAPKDREIMVTDGAGIHFVRWTKLFLSASSQPEVWMSRVWAIGNVNPTHWDELPSVSPYEYGWLPKESAPTDGSWFLVMENESPMCWAPYAFAAWQDMSKLPAPHTNWRESYFSGTDTSEEIDFDWWQPLPWPKLL